MTGKEDYDRLMAMTPEERRETIMREARERVENPKTPLPPMISLAECEDRRLYEIYSRNLIVGVFRAATSGFIGIREKFGSRYLFEEYHHDTGAPFGTVRPELAMGVFVPPEIQLSEHLTGPGGARLQCDVCRRWAEQYRGSSYPDQPPGPPFYRHLDEPEGQDICKVGDQTYGRASLASNKALFDFLDEHTR